MPKVLITSREVAPFETRFRDVLEAAALELVYPPPGRFSQLTEEELLAGLPGIVATIAGSETYTPAVFTANLQLRVIARVGVGYDAVDLPAATRNGTVVTIAPNTNHGSVAEHTFALLLAFTRHIPTRHGTMAQGEWPRFTSLPLRGRTLALAGLGRIGKAVATRAAAFDMKLIAYDPAPDPAFCAAHQIRLVSFSELLPEADFLSLHLPLIPQTRHLINRTTLAQMKPTAVLVNTSRGGLVNEADLIEALRGQRIAGAGLDVFEEEPLPVVHALRSLPNVVLTPHAAGVDVQSIGDMARSAAEAIVAIQQGLWPDEKIVNPEVREHFHWC